jgi:superfamily II DNA or RNA helicase
MQELTHESIVPGIVVLARGEHWHVRQARHQADVSILALEGADESNRRRTATLLLPFDRVQPLAEPSPARRRRDAVVRGILQAAGRARPARGLWCAASARLEILPWQLTPALSVLDGATRLLLADAVGLGKTVQAGLVLAELRARGLADRALVLAPAAVRAHWAAELRTRFDLPVRVLDLPALLELERAGPAGANPWSRVPVVVSSIDLVKRPEVCAAVERVPLDVLVVDEAHHATPGTDRHALVRRLARQVPWVVLASATPHSGNTGAFRALLAIGEDGASASPMRVFRRSHLDVRFQVPRRTRVLRVRPSPQEQALQAGVLAYARDLCRGPGGAGAAVQLLASVLARRATSSPWAARLTLARRLEWLASAGQTGPDLPPSLPWEETEPDAGDGPWLAADGLPSRADERARLRYLVARADAALPHWSKLARLRRLVRRVREPVIVFSEFRETLEACVPALEAVATVACLHGGLDMAERQRRLTAFLDGGAQVLLTTDVAGEGLNLQQPARLVVTLEWPWSPLRLEQRIGRVHRLGQTRVVHAVHLTARDSYEETVVARVLQRAARAADALATTTREATHEVAAEVLGVPLTDHQVVRPGDAAAAAGSTDARARTEARRLAQARRLLAMAPPGPFQAAWALPRRGAGGTRAVVVLEVTEHLPSGPVRASRVVAVSVTLREPPAARRTWRQICRQLALDSRVWHAAGDTRADAPYDEQWAPVRARLASLRALRHRHVPRTVQPSLFDRRAIRDAEQSDAVRAQWDEWQARLEARLEAAPVRSTARVLAVLPVDGGAP